MLRKIHLQAATYNISSSHDQVAKTKAQHIARDRMRVQAHRITKHQSFFFLLVCSYLMEDFDSYVSFYLSLELGIFRCMDFSVPMNDSERLYVSFTRPISHTLSLSRCLSQSLSGILFNGT